MARLRGRIDNTDRLARTLQGISERASEDPNTRTRRVLSSGLPTFEPTDFDSRQIVAKDFRTALNVGESAAGVRFTSSGIEGYNSGINKTIDIKVDGSGTLGIGGTQIAWGTTGTVAVPGAGINSGSIAGIKLENGAVSSIKLADGSVLTTKIGDNEVTADKLTTGTITGVEFDRIVDGAVVGSSNIITLLADKVIFATGDDLDDLAGSESGTTVIEGGKIRTNSITASKINVTELSAVSADLGSVTAGTVTGVTIRSASSGARVELNSGGVDVHGSSDSLVQFRSTPDGSVDGSVFGFSGGLAVQAGEVTFTGNPNPLNNGAASVGVSGREWGNSYIRTMQTNVLTGIGTDIRFHTSAGGNRIGFFSAAAQAKQTVSGARDDPEGALASLLSALSTIGLFNNSTTAT